jgi:MFS family permease
VIVTHLHYEPSVVGLLIAVEQVGASIALVVTGRLGTRGHERAIMRAGAGLTAVGMLMIFIAAGIPLIAIGLFIAGVGSGPYWVALYGLRQRRTSPHMFARAFAMSYTSNSVGQPLGSAAAGLISSVGSVSAAIALAVVFPLLAIAALRLVPADPIPPV